MQLAELNWPALEALNRDTPVVIPVAAVEQHSHHLPVYTDSLILGEIVRRLESSFASQVLFAPLLWLGNSHHHLDFPGTLSASPRTYLDLLQSLLQNFLTHGFRRIVLLNGHGGNIVPTQQAIFEVRQQRRDRADLLLLATTYWEWADPGLPARLGLVQTNMGHACEWETSMLLHLAPQWVGDYHQADEIPAGNEFAPAHRAWITRERSVPGHIGSPHAAHADKGSGLLDGFAEGLVGFFQRVLDWDGSSWK